MCITDSPVMVINVGSTHRPALTGCIVSLQSILCAFGGRASTHVMIFENIETKHYKDQSSYSGELS